METVAELMTSSPVVVTTATPLAQAAHILLTLRIRHLPVVDESGRLAGLLSDYTVFREPVSPREAPSTLTVGDLAGPAVVVTRPDDSLSRALNRMLELRSEAIIAVDDARHPVGIVTEHDGVRLAQGVLSPQQAAIASASWPVFSVERDQPASVALSVMRRNAVRHVVVTEQGVLFGVLSLRDLIVADVGRMLGERADEVMTSGRVVRSVGDRPLLWMARQMSAHRIGCIPIVDAEERPRAIVTRTDILHSVVETLENEALFPSDPKRMAG